MRNKGIVEIYDSILKQVRNKIGKKITIYDPYGSSDISAKDFNVTQKFIDMCTRRRNYWKGRGI